MDLKICNVDVTGRNNNRLTAGLENLKNVVMEVEFVHFNVLALLKF